MNSAIDDLTNLFFIPLPNHIHLRTPFAGRFRCIRFYVTKLLFSPFYRYVLTMLKNDLIADTFIFDFYLYFSRTVL